jgi:hypothetical protein
MFSIKEVLHNLLQNKELTNSSFNAVAACDALDNKLEHKLMQEPNSLLCGRSTTYVDFLPSTTWGWFTSLT